MSVSGQADSVGDAGGEGARGHPALVLLLGALIYVVLLVYASLVPFAFQPLDLAEAWARFRAIPFLALGPESRADWIANLVAYAPLGFLLAASAGGRASVSQRGFAAIGAIATCWTLAVGVEFVQVFFVPRTVSLNDLVAEALGSTLGALAGLVAAPRSAQAMAALRRGGRPALRLIVGLYALAYLAMTLFPYDFVIDSDELHARLALSATQLWMLPGWDRSALHGLAATGIAVAAMMPLGALVARSGASPVGGVVRALVAGLLLGALIEGLQAVLLSGISDLVSVLARGVGAALGAVALAGLRRADLPRLRRRLRPLAFIALLPYLALLAALNDLVGGGWTDIASAQAKLAETSFMPFYYHYFTTEAVAFASAASRVAMYAPAGMLLWLWRRPGAGNGGSVARAIAAAAILAAVLAALCEGGRLFKPGLRADPTNLWIAAAAAGLAYALLELGWHWLVRAPARAAPPAGPARPAAPMRPAVPTLAAFPAPYWQWGPALLLVLAAAAGVATYPLHPQWLALGLLAYGALLWRWPQAWLVLLPALLPTLDLAPWSGRFFFDESDFLVLATAAVLCARQDLFRGHGMAGRLAGALVALLAAAQFVALMRGLVPLEPIGDNAFNNYFSAYNALRVAKGFGWALLLFPALALALARDSGAALGRLGLGLLLGLGVVTLVSLRERLVFTGLFDFEEPFRITATFSSMHLGGGSIGAFLALTLPFLALPFVRPAPPLLRLAAAGLLVGATYVLLVTFNRAAYLGGLAGFLVLLVALPAVLGRREGAWQPAGRILLRRLGPVAGLAAVAALVAGLLAVALPGSFAAERFERVSEDLETRLWQWREGLALADDGPAAAVFGSGLGSYPRDFLLRNIDGRVPTTFAIAHEAAAGAGEGGAGARTYLRLGSGENLYFGQRVAVRPDTTYRLTLSLRAATPESRLAVPICEKTLLYSFRCDFATFAPTTPGAWEQQESEFRLADIGRSGGIVGWLAGRPVELALYNPIPGTTLDIDDVSLVALDGAAAGQELLANGGFESGTDRWFFAADNLSIWRVENMWLMTLFEQGWFGLAALALAVAAALVGLLRRVAGRPAAEAAPAAVLFAGLAGFLVVGLAHGLVDAPRLMTLFYLLLFAALCLARAPEARHQPHWRPSANAA